MAKKPKTYDRLAWRMGATGFFSLWQAADHLVVVKSNGYREEYARIGFRDIKGFFLNPSPRRGWWTAIWGLLGVASLILVLANFGNDETPWISGSFLALFVVALLWNFWLSAGCRAYVVTDVQTALIPAIIRRRKADRILARIEPAIRAAQSDLIPPPPPFVGTEPTPPAA